MRKRERGENYFRGFLWLVHGTCAPSLPGVKRTYVPGRRECIVPWMSNTWVNKTNPFVRHTFLTFLPFLNNTTLNANFDWFKYYYLYSKNDSRQLTLQQSTEKKYFHSHPSMAHSIMKLHQSLWGITLVAVSMHAKSLARKNDSDWRNLPGSWCILFGKEY